MADLQKRAEEHQKTAAELYRLAIDSDDDPFILKTIASALAAAEATGREQTANELETERELRQCDERNLANLLTYASNPSEENWKSLVFSGVAITIRDHIRQLAGKGGE